MTIRETPLLLDCQGEHLVGILCEPADGATPSGLGVLIVVGGPQYRVGSHRQFVQLARALAGRGHVVLRFDVRGMGDSTGPLRNFEAIEEDIACATDELLRRQPGLAGVVWAGLCDGASAALMQAGSRPHPRVLGICALNPWLRSAESLASTQLRHYYLRRFLSLSTWRQLLTGRLGMKALAGFWQTVRQSRTASASPSVDSPRQAVDYRQRMLAGLKVFRRPVLFVTCSEDLTAKEFEGAVRRHPGWQQALQEPWVQLQRMAGADHTLSTPGAPQEFERRLAEWLGPLCVLERKTR
jgi:exosortase A-associated hydrolase 1